MTSLSAAEVDLAYRLALEWCGECRDYHATRPFLMASGVRAGPERDRAVFAPMLARHTAPGSRILIAGAADAGLLAFVHGVVGDRHPAITIVDICPTPLELSRRHAAAEGLSIDTTVADLTDDTALGPFDLIISHAALPFFSATGKIRMLDGLRQMLAPGGVLIAAYPLPRVRPANNPDFYDAFHAGLAAAGIALPDGVLESIQRIRTTYRDGRAPPDDQPDRLPALLATSGLSIIEQDTSHPTARRVGPYDWTSAPRHYVVAGLA